MQSPYLKILISLIALLFLTHCAPAEQASPTPTESGTVRLMTHDSFSVSETVLAEFEAETGLTVELIKGGDGGQLVNNAILAADDPVADVLFGVDNSLLSRALENDIFIPSDSPHLANIPAEFQLDPENRALPVTYGDVCLNYDRAWFESAGLAPPESLSDLTDPAYRALTVVQNPATSTPGLAFLLATVDNFGPEGYLDFWTALRENEVLVTSGWEDAYYGQFTAASDGERPIVVSYASSPVAEVLFAEPAVDEAPTAAVTGPKTCFRQIEFAGVLRNAANPQAAQQLLDFMLGPTFQADVPLQMFVYPTNQSATLPDVFAEYSVIPTEPARVAPADIAANRSEWVEAWTRTVLR